MKVAIHANSEAPIGTLIERLLEQADDVFIASAYISAKAVDTLAARTQQRASGTLAVDILFGLDAETDLKAVQRIYDVSLKDPERIRVRYTPHRSGRLFHPKVYFFRHRSTCHIIIASANLTEAGQRTNEELYCHLECASTHETVAQFNVIRQVWLSEPFSAVLAENIVAERSGIEFHRDQLKKAEEAFGKIISDVGVRPIILPPPDPIPPPPPDAKQLLLAQLEKGYLISTDFSVAPLSVSIPIREAQKVDSANGSVVIRTSLTASVQLLSEEACDEFAQLYRDAKKIVEQHSVLVPSGLSYVPPSAQASFKSNMRSVLNKHKQLIHKHIYFKGPINTQLTRLEADCAKERQKYSSQPGIITEEEFLQVAKARIKERREAFKDDPQAAVRLIISPYPHPLVYRMQNPNHAAWDLCETELDDDLLATLLAILLGQVNVIIEATQKRQHPSVQADYRQAKLLISIKGKAIGSLLDKLHRIAHKDWEKANKRGKLTTLPQTPGKLMIQDLTKLREQATAHKSWLEALKHRRLQDAFRLILDEYPSVDA